MPFSLDINALRLSKRTTQPNLQAVEVFWFNLVIKSIKAMDRFMLTQVDESKLSCNTPHRHSTTVSLETYPF